MYDVKGQLKKVLDTLPDGVRLVAISKYHPNEYIEAAYAEGQRIFGESHEQELRQKVTTLPHDIQWHFIGHLQTNKVRDLIKLHPYLIESVDSERLLRTINDEAAKLGIIQDVLLEVHTAKEETKTGLKAERIEEILDFTQDKLLNIRILGLMTMATNTDDETEIRRCFQTAQALLSTLNIQPSTLSMGMSDDYRIAIECGSTMVRIGSAIFGERDYRRKIRAVFFDQDGILFNSMPFHAKAWEQAMQQNGIPYTAMDCYRNEGRTGSGVIQEIYERLHGVKASDELIHSIYATKSDLFLQLTHGQLPDTIEGVRDVLAFLRAQGVQCWVVTGSGQRNLINRLNDTFDHAFTGIISSFDCTKGKPDPEPYLKAWERCGFAKDECMVVENAPLGVRAAKAAGLFTVAVNTGILPDEVLQNEHADLVVPNMSALLQWLQNQFNTHA